MASWPLGSWIHLASRHARLSKLGFNFLMIVVAVISTACNRKSADQKGATEVVLYTSVDEPYVRPLVNQFQKET
ncbi:MAG TPA: hypothetical protein VH370_25650, partial [Humisphaera sp.]|nr:hypothetical protein [Humisphaera sp.]